MDLEKRILNAKKNNTEMNKLISEYIPFIKSIINKINIYNIDYDDKLSVAMVVFMNCIKQYEPEKGNFLSFSSICIKNRIIDESRKQKNYSSKVIPFVSNDDEFPAEEILVSLSAYNKEQERLVLSQEIQQFSEKLDTFDISFEELSKICPKQKRSRENCINIAQTIVRSEEMLYSLNTKRMLPQKQISEKLNISVKTLEKHRKYIISLTILLTDDYPIMQSFLPHFKEVVR